MKSIILLILLLCILACTGPIKTNGELEIYTIVDSVQLNYPVMLYDFVANDKHFISIDKYDNQIVLFNKQGELKSTFGRKGRGPKEFSNPMVIKTFDNIIFVIDQNLNKIVLIQYDDNNEELTYRSEFKLMSFPASICILEHDKILVTLFGVEQNLALVDYSGNVLREYDFMEPSSINDSESYLKSIYFIANLDSEFFLLGGAASGLLYFCRFNHDNDTIEVISKLTIEGFDKLKEVFDIDRGNIDGLGYIYIMNDNYYIGFNPNNEAIEESFFQRYDKHGNYLGKTVIKDELEYFFAFDEDEIYFMRLLEGNDEMIYVAKEIKE